jgi:hypothetical protein
MRLSLRRIAIVFAILATSTFAWTSVARAQSRVGKDSLTRLTQFGHDVVYIAVTGVGWAAWDQINNDPSEWGRGWNGYGRRLASGVGRSLIQEGVSQGLAAVMNRPIGYTRCRCTGNGARVKHAALAAVTDEMPNGSHPIAVPRIVGAYAGAFAQEAWMPGNHNRVASALFSGTASLGLGAAINLYYEFKRK